MAKKGITPLSKKATSGASFLKKQGYAVPASLLQEMLARTEGFSSYAAYLASYQANAQDAVQAKFEGELFTLRLIYDAMSSKWLYLPWGVECLYDARTSGELLDAFINEACDTLRDEEAAADLLVSVDVNKLPVALKKVFVVGPDFERYGVPPVKWILNDFNFQRLPSEACMDLAEDLTDFYDLGDDGGGFTVVEVQVPKVHALELESEQRALFRTTAQEIVGEIRDKGREYGFSADALVEVIKNEYSGQFIDTPEFFQQVSSV